MRITIRHFHLGFIKKLLKEVQQSHNTPMEAYRGRGEDV
jgi:hypothetical protein